MHYLFDNKNKPELWYEEIYYKKIDKNGNVLISDKRLTWSNQIHSQEPQLGVDAEDNIHIVWVENYLYTYYKKLNKYGNILINNTEVSNENHKIQ